MLVQVELKDLETIIFATAVIKQIEAALVQQRRDPFVHPHLDYKKAHDNLVTAMNHARRANAGTAIDWEGKLTWKEFNFLHHVNEKFEKTSEYTKIDGDYRKEHPEVDSLMAKGCILMGQSVVGQVWPGDTQASIKPLPFFSVKITSRGLNKLKEYEESSLKCGNSV